MKKEEYEIIQHNDTNFHIFLVNLLYRAPHIHKDYEISMVMEGELSLIGPDGKSDYKAGDIFLINPYHSHELKADSPALILSLQVSQNFFASYYPKISSLEFDMVQIQPASRAKTSSEAAAYGMLRSELLSLAKNHYSDDPYSPIQSSISINKIFLYLLCHIPHHEITEKERETALSKGKRMRFIMDYIDEHHTEKLLLSDIADKEKLDLYYLSHFFKENFGVSFQSYLTKVRAEHARQLLLLTDYSLLDISISSGFSDPKYFNQGFAGLYGCTPKEYRKTFKNAALKQQQKSMLTTQEFLSAESALIVLERNYGP